MKSHASNSRLINNKIIGFMLNLVFDLVLYRTIMANTMVYYWCGVIFDNLKGFVYAWTMNDGSMIMALLSSLIPTHAFY